MDPRSCLASTCHPSMMAADMVPREATVPMHSRSVTGTLAAATVLACAGRPAAGQSAPMTCAVSAAETRWLADSYRETHTYGLGGSEKEWIGSYGGLAASVDTLFFYDQSRPRIVHLSGELEERHVFGRQGEGPGELNWAVPIVWLSDVAEGHVAFDGRQLVVYDRNDVASFDPAGNFRWSAQLPYFGLARSGVVFVGPVDEEEMIFGVDPLFAGSRRLQLWAVRRPEPNHRELLWERPIFRRARDPATGGSFSVHRREARSYWARHKDCLFISDGGSSFLWVVDLSTLQTDSIALPKWKVPEFGALRSDFSVTNIGGRDIAEPQEPGLLWRWRGLIVDPDGHVWLRAWTESREEFVVFVVSLQSGESRRMNNPPGFPTAFGPPGVFYTAREAADTDEQFLVRLESERR